MLVTWKLVLFGSRPNRFMAPTTRWSRTASTPQVAATDYVTMIIMFRTVRHMPNGTTFPDLVALCYQIQLNVWRGLSRPRLAC
jgi:hypothetical protein